MKYPYFDEFMFSMRGPRNFLDAFDSYQSFPDEMLKYAIHMEMDKCIIDFLKAGTEMLSLYNRLFAMYGPALEKYKDYLNNQGKE